MQEFVDDDNLTYKRLAKFDIEKEHIYKKLTIFQYREHLYQLNRSYASTEG